MIQEFLQHWPRTFDFLPLLSLQRKVAGNQELYCFYGSVSTPKPTSILDRIAPGREEIETELGIKARYIDIDRKRIEFKFGEGQDDPTHYAPRELNIRTQREILDNIIGEFGLDVPEVVLEARGVLENPPMRIQDSLQGVENIFHYQMARFTPRRLLRKLLGIRSLQSSFTLMRPELLARGVVLGVDGRRFKSTNVTDHMLFYDGRQYGQPNAPEIAGAVQQELCSDRWWQDWGLPEEARVKIPGEVMMPRVFRLQKMQKPYAVLW